MKARRFSWSMKFVAVLMGICPAPAMADFVRTGIAPCGAGDQVITEATPPPITLDSPCTTARFGSTDISVNSTTATIRGSVEAAPARTPDGAVYDLGVLESYGTDNDTLHFTGAGTVTAQVVVDGTGTMPGTDPFGDAGFAYSELFFGIGHMEDTYTRVGFTSSPYDLADTNEMPGSTFPIVFTSPVLTFSVTGTATVPDDLVLDFTLYVGAANGASIDLSDTAQLVLDLGPGISVTSDGGFSQSSSPAVPEPSSLAMVLTGAAAMFLFGRGRRWTNGRRLAQGSA